MSMEGDNKRATTIINYESLARDQVKKEVDGYIKLFTAEDASVEERKAKYETLVNSFYDLVTNFYEYGWGQSFHFAPRHRFESFEASIARHEMYLAHRLHLEKGQVALDVGCGVGGPARCIARFSEANIVGLNNNDYQIGRAKLLTKEARLEHLINYMKADFMHIPAEVRTFLTLHPLHKTSIDDFLHLSQIASFFD
jgi:sterol 24-C-methyltransferase